jgi:hypothetical protein
MVGLRLKKDEEEEEEAKEVGGGSVLINVSFCVLRSEVKESIPLGRRCGYDCRDKFWEEETSVRTRIAY